MNRPPRRTCHSDRPNTGFPFYCDATVAVRLNKVDRRSTAAAAIAVPASNPDRPSFQDDTKGRKRVTKRGPKYDSDKIRKHSELCADSWLMKQR